MDALIDDLIRTARDLWRFKEFERLVTSPSRHRRLHSLLVSRFNDHGENNCGAVTACSLGLREFSLSLESFTPG